MMSTQIAPQTQDGDRAGERVWRTETRRPRRPRVPRLGEDEQRSHRLSTARAAQPPCQLHQQ